MKLNVDWSNLAKSMARPGCDTRISSSLAIAKDDSVIDSDGVFVDVILCPSQQEITARVGSSYAGVGFGLYSKIKKDDELIVSLPLGDPAEGAVVVGHQWSASDPPPQNAIDHENDVVLVVEENKNLRLTIAGEGNVIIDSPKTKIGSEQADEPVPLGNVLVDALTKAISETGADGILSLSSGCFICSIGPVYLSPAAAANIVAWGLKFLTESNTNILSQKVMVER